MKDMQVMVEKSKETFPLRKELIVRVKKHPINPFNSSVMQSFIDMSKTHPEYLIYVHTKYVRFRCPSRNMEPIRVILDDKLWIELLFVFDFIDLAENRK